MIRVFRYGHRLYPATEEDRKALAQADGYVEVEEYLVVPGSSIRKRHALSVDEFRRKSEVLAEAVASIRSGATKDTVAYYRRAYGPGFDEILKDYGLVSRTGICASFHDQTQDNCDGCTFNVGTGGPEFGYGGGCVLTEVFKNSPDEGFGRGDPAAHDPDHTPGKGAPTARPPRSTHRQSAEKKHFPGDTVYNNDLGADEPFGDEQGVHPDPNLRGPNEGVAGVPIDPTHHDVESDNTQRLDSIPGVYKVRGRKGGQVMQGGRRPRVARVSRVTYGAAETRDEGERFYRSFATCTKCGHKLWDDDRCPNCGRERAAGEVGGVFDTKEPPSVGNLDGGVTMLPGGNR